MSNGLYYVSSGFLRQYEVLNKPKHTDLIIGVYNSCSILNKLQGENDELKLELEKQSKVIEVLRNACEFLNTKANFDGKRYYQIDEALKEVERINNN